MLFFFARSAVSISVESSSEIDSIHYVVVDQIGGFLNGTKYLNAKLNEFDLSFDATALMASEVNVLVYYIHHTGEVIYDTVAVKFDENLPNQVSFYGFPLSYFH
jgi:hypothetical protein